MDEEEEEEEGANIQSGNKTQRLTDSQEMSNFSGT